MDIKISMSVGMVVAVVAGEFLSMLWYSDAAPWGRYSGNRYWLSSLACDVGLAFIVQSIMTSYWTVRRYEDAAMLAFWLTLLYITLEGPHQVWNSSRSFSRFLSHAAHKFALIFLVAVCLWHFKDY